jgi:hypothetical protein
MLFLTVLPGIYSEACLLMKYEQNTLMHYEKKELRERKEGKEEKQERIRQRHCAH